LKIACGLLHVIKIHNVNEKCLEKKNNPKYVMVQIYHKMIHDLKVCTKIWTDGIREWGLLYPNKQKRI